MIQLHNELEIYEHYEYIEYLKFFDEMMMLQHDKKLIDGMMVQVL